MTTGHKLAVSLVIVLTLLLGVAGYTYVEDKVALARHDEQTDANNGAVKTLQDSNHALADQLTTVVATLNDLKRNTKTTTQIVQAAPQVITLPAPVKEVTAAEAAVPNSPVQAGDLVIPAVSAKAFFDAQVDCKANAATLTTCQETAKNNAAIIAVKDKQIAQDAIVIKGGTKMQRFVKAAKWVGVGVGVGVAVSYAAKH